MARGINKVILLGNLGRDPDTRSTPGGITVCTVNLATTSSWKNRDSGERQEKTEWHRVVFFARLAEIAAEYLRKGSHVYIEGRLQTRQWQDEANGGVTRYTTEIIASEMLMLGGRDSTARYEDSAEGMSKPSSDVPSSDVPERPAASGLNDQLDDEIPF